MYTLGQALVYTKHQFWDGNDINKHCEWTFNLLGEPAMPIWTNTPGNVKVTYPSPIPVGTSTFLVHVEDAVTHVPVSQALVCLRKESEVYLTGVTNSNGDVILYPSPSTNGNMYVDVTAHNYLLNETIAVVSAGPGAPYLPSNPSPALGATTVDVMTNLAWTSGDPNGDTVTYDVYFGLSFPLPLVASDFPSTTYDPPGDLSYGKTYYWKIVADDNNGSITYGPTWSFTTLSERYMRIDHAQGISGSQLTMYLTGKWNLTIGGYDMAMYYDASKITITKIDLVGTVADYPDTEWQVYPVYGTGKAAAAAIAMDYNPPDDILPPGLGTLFRITVTIKDGAVNGDTILNLDENVIIGSVPYYCTYAPPEGPVVFPELVDGVLTISDYICGDVNNDGVVNVGDVVYLINYLYKGGDPPVPMPCVGDVNNDSVVNVGDVVYLINYLYRGGSAPGTCCQ